VSNLKIRSLHSELKDEGSLKFPFLMFSTVVLTEEPSNGGLPITIIYNMHPIAQRSLMGPNLFPWIVSGDK
jgi:hypothetical protein